MIKAEAIVRAEYEHSMDVKIDVSVDTTESLLFPEIVTLLMECYKGEPEITMNAIESALNRIGEEFIQEGLKNAKK